MNKPSAWIVLLALTLSTTAVFSQSIREKDRNDILEVLFAQQTDWNEGDIPAFMESYWRSDSLVFVSEGGPKMGWDNTLARYRKNYPDKNTIGELTFQVIKLSSLSKHVALMVGSWHLKRNIGDIGGYFTLVWKKIDGKWVIVSDHTS